MKKVLTGTEAAAVAAGLARIDVVSAYPITPQTVIVETLADMIGRGELNAQYSNVESEHSAMACCIGAAAVGARAFTATSSQGLALMHEVLHYAANGRMPIVMVNVNRALAPPWNLYCDQSDSLSQRDTGWLQYYCADCQDVLDSIIVAYKVAEHVSLPVMLNLDAFYLSHTSEVVDVPAQEAVDSFIPKNLNPVLDPGNPVTFGNVCGPDLYTSIRFVRHRDTVAALEVWQKDSDAYGEIFGRYCRPIEEYLVEDAQEVLVAAGSAAGTLKLAVDQLRREGHKVGSLRIALVRPFPAKLIEKVLAAARRVVVVERAVSNGVGGFIGHELKAGLFGRRNDLEIWSLFCGLGGKDITPEGLAAKVKSLLGASKTVSRNNRSKPMDGAPIMNQPFLQQKTMGPGHLACAGCGAAVAMRYALEALGPETIVVIPAGCWSTFIGVYPYSCLSVPVISVAFATTASTASGVKAGLDALGRDDETVLAWAGDGGTFDIGFQALSAAAERNDDILFVCYDNEAYMNTGVQRSSATPTGTVTTTTPASAPKQQRKKDILAIMAAHGVPYTATASIAYPGDLIAKLTKAKSIRGTKFIHLYASCPTGWRHAPELSVEVARMAVKSRVFPLYEVTDGENWRLSPMPEKEPIDAYLKIQGRFKDMGPEAAAEFQNNVERRWQILVHKCRDAP